ncbi:hypothetical protein SASPL_108961 [Salvia splendens]|uniref:FGGY carbohydrate kinase domain-containing protein n=1 Tax=Salvia splendens TaxID=180675 RepID=A0A8X9A743_SALSN|nr:hypothetical protein SASPL_108961 [Salvia splendens]
MSGANRLINPPNQGHLSSAVEMTTPNCPITPRSRTGPMFLGVDVGTASARAAIFNDRGRLLGFATSPIQIWKDGDCVEESSTDIWHAICTAVRSACSVAQIKGEQVTSLGFAATCSLVAIDSDGEPVTVSLTHDSRRNVIVWMDHRAVKQSERINLSKSPVLEYCGGSVSPEMQTPKLLWVKENLKESWSMTFRWMDLSDWLSYRATGDDTRSLCTTVCKWTYLGHAHMQQINETDSRDMEALGWDDEFWEEIGLGDLVDSHHSKIGRSVAFPGHALGSGLTPNAAKARKLTKTGTPVGTSLIDAHAGGVGVMESVPPEITEHEPAEDEETICHRMVLVCGTSNCHMAISKTKLFIPGVWGPFWSAMVPEYWLTEGGQSASGALFEHILEGHPAYQGLANRAAARSEMTLTSRNEFSISCCFDQRHPCLAYGTRHIYYFIDKNCVVYPSHDPKVRKIISLVKLIFAIEKLTITKLELINSIPYTSSVKKQPNPNGRFFLDYELGFKLSGTRVLRFVEKKRYCFYRSKIRANSAAVFFINYYTKRGRLLSRHREFYQSLAELFGRTLWGRALHVAALNATVKSGR